MKDKWESWFGQLPADFAISRVKHHFEIDPGKMLQSGSDKNSDTSVRYFSVGNVQWGSVDCTTLRSMAASLSDVKRYRIEIGDLLVCEGGEGGRSAVVTSLPSKGIVIYQNHLNRVRPRLDETGDVHYLRYALESASSLGLFQALNSGATIKSLSKQKLANIVLPLPNIETQRAIVRYLDHAEVRIARAIQAKLKILRLLRELRAVKIQSSIFSGSVKSGLKDSGQQWLGLIPSHWDLIRMKHLVTERSEKGYQDLPLLAATQSMGVVTKDTFGQRTVTAQSGLETLKLVEIGDFVISLRSFQGGIELSRAKGIISPAYTVLRPNDETMTAYLALLFKTPRFIDALRLSVKGIREGQNINYGNLSLQYLPVPPASERAEMVAQLKQEVSSLDGTISATEREIDLLREYRTRLIADVVTGKKDVRAEAASLPDVDPLELARVLSGTTAIEEDVEEEVGANGD